NAHLEGDRSNVRFVQTNLARVFLAGLTELNHADFALLSGGGVRDSFEAGAITYLDVLLVQPFGNPVSRVVMIGCELEMYLAVVA
ncbi:5'-nucleotidase C-terminal domain-containing protein, partial [Erwinia amylovora]|uniref:5'-nucleotidase C-terminal domain-containing protein n=1 Tax=Erwinia amylovora TaxID=552 RepID=UPI00200B8BE1